jgi:hypothetical protein
LARNDLTTSLTLPLLVAVVNAMIVTTNSSRRRLPWADVEEKVPIGSSDAHGSQPMTPPKAAFVGVLQAPTSSVEAKSVTTQRPFVVGSWPLLVVSILFFTLSLVVFSMSSCFEAHVASITSEQQLPPSPQQHTQHPDVIYGHAHIAKTAGTTLNGNLSMHYERICGHKGYSYDALSTNERARANNHFLEYSGDSYSKLVKQSNRGKVPPSIMREIGFHNCDWISHESRWQAWLRFQNWSIPMELHVPCRSPVDHLMSQCNYWRKAFDCNLTGQAMIEQIEGCIVYIHQRYNKKLNATFPTKCFDHVRTSEYMDWIGKRLQKRRIEADYAFRASNRKRHKEQECVWDRPDVQQVITNHLIANYDYYNFCDQCLGSEHDLFASKDMR